MTTLGAHANGRENNFLLLRFVSAALVIFSHSFAVVRGAASGEPPSPYIQTSFGTLAVNVFFTISGFLIAKSFIDRRRLGDFCLARVLRIYPALLGAVAFTAYVVGLAFTSMNRAEYLRDPSTTSYVVHDATMVWLKIQSVLPGVFAHKPLPYAVNDPLWTLPYELRMYALVAVAGSLRLLSSRRVFNTAGAVALAALWALHASGGATRYEDWLPLFERLGVFFLAGAFCYVNREWIVVDWRVWGAFVVVAVLLYPTAWFMAAFWSALVYSVFAFAYLPEGRIRSFNRMGDYSYGLYIYGFPVQQVVSTIAPTAGPWLVFALSMAATLPIAVASWIFIEAPALRLKSHRAGTAAGPLAQAARA